MCTYGWVCLCTYVRTSADPMCVWSTCVLQTCVCAWCHCGACVRVHERVYVCVRMPYTCVNVRGCAVPVTVPVKTLKEQEVQPWCLCRALVCACISTCVHVCACALLCVDRCVRVRAHVCVHYVCAWLCRGHGVCSNFQANLMPVRVRIKYYGMCRARGTWARHACTCVCVCAACACACACAYTGAAYACACIMYVTSIL